MKISLFLNASAAVCFLAATIIQFYDKNSVMAMLNLLAFLHCIRAIDSAISGKINDIQIDQNSLIIDQNNMIIRKLHDNHST